MKKEEKEFKYLKGLGKHRIEQLKMIAKKEFNLSEKIINGKKFQKYKTYTWKHQDWIHKEDVKEFIKKLKEATADSKNYLDKNRAIWFSEKVIDKLTGKNLI